jgi:hypothetical protein
MKRKGSFSPDNPGKPFDGVTNRGQPGRVKGSRNRLSERFIADLQAEWEEHGASTLRIARIERPVEFCKMVASILPKEFEISDSRIKEIPDDQLDILLQWAERNVARRLDRKSEGGEDPTLN